MLLCVTVVCGSCVQWQQSVVAHSLQQFDLRGRITSVGRARASGRLGVAHTAQAPALYALAVYFPMPRPGIVRPEHVLHLQPGGEAGSKLDVHIEYSGCRL